MCIHIVLLLAISLAKNAVSQDAPNHQEIRCLAHYHYSSSTPDYLKAIITNITLNESKAYSYNLIYSGAVSEQTCHHLEAISFTDKHYSSQFDVSTLTCPRASDINVTVEAIGSINTSSTTTIKIDGINKFVNISFNKAATSITCTFINQPRKPSKSCIVKYGYCDGNNLSSHVEGNILNSNSISLELHHLSDTATICFTVEASNGTKVVKVVGEYDVSADTSPSMMMIIIALLFGLTAILLLLLVIIIAWIFYTNHRDYKDYKRVPDYSIDSGHHWSMSGNKVNQQKLPWKQIDLSTTYFKLLRPKRDQKLQELFAEKIKHYNHEDGHGFRRLTAEEVESINFSKKVIVMDPTNPENPMCVASVLVVKQRYPEENYPILYVQSRNYTRRVALGDHALYCARSKVVIAYSKVYTVDKTCKESEFVANTMPGYQREWSRYGYFQWMREESIKVHQQVIVMKKDGTLVTGIGVRHLLGVVGSVSNTKPPNLSVHKDWKYVFIQSRGDDRELQQGTPYLFCALMDQVNVYYNIYDVKECTNMASFGRQHIPGFRPDLGYGYYEFKSQEYFKSHKRVILVHKNKKLYTGAGAKFFCIKGQYNEDVKSRIKKISPPVLFNTEWMHVFIQSRSNKRKLLPGTKFLYCEYK